MIRNIVFDMGNVLIAYEPEKYAKRFAETAQDQALLAREVFGGPEWKKLDEGTMSEEEAWAGMTARLPKYLHEPARQCLEHWFEGIKAIDGMEAVAEGLKKQGYHLYLCSNASLRFRQYEKVMVALKEKLKQVLG